MIRRNKRAYGSYSSVNALKTSELQGLGQLKYRHYKAEPCVCVHVATVSGMGGSLGETEKRLFFSHTVPRYDNAVGQSIR